MSDLDSRMDYFKKFAELQHKNYENEKYLKETHNKIRHYYSGDDLECGVKEYNALGYKVQSVVINNNDFYTVIYERF